MGRSGQRVLGRGTFWLSLCVVTTIGAVIGCSRPASDPVTITFLDPEWAHDMASNRLTLMQEALQEFTQETGIQVKHLPAPENATDQLTLVKKLLQQGTAGPDVYGIDIVWPGILQNDMIDLRGLEPQGFGSEDPVLVANYTVKGRLVALPYHTNMGVLFYRTDLLRKYGYAAPPTSWDELEKMAVRIQKGERAAGKHNFWGYVWAGAGGEGLTCMALEWQAAEGGGRIVEPDGRVSVNNPKAISAWKRAAQWVGTISSPSVLSYQEVDANNVFKNAGNSAFIRSWISDYFLSHPVSEVMQAVMGVTRLPGPAVVGGFGLSVSRYSAHQAEAIKLVQFLYAREQKIEEARAHAPLPFQPVMYNLPEVLKAYSRSRAGQGLKANGVVTRPSTVTGENYAKVSRAYSDAVYSVLSKKADAEDAAARLEGDLESIQGLPRKNPMTAEAVHR